MSICPKQKRAGNSFAGKNNFQHADDTDVLVDKIIGMVMVTARMPTQMADLRCL